MPIEFKIFLLGLFVFGLLVFGTFLIYVEAFEEEIEREGYEMPGWLRRVFALLGARPTKPDDSSTNAPRG